MSNSPNLVLTGFMGTGKTTAGRLLAGRLSRDFVDTDALIEREAKMTVREIFTRLGEPAFREMEREACRRVSQQPGQVIAIGGGALLDARNREVLEQTGVIVLLTCETRELAGRLRESAQRGERPLLAGDIDETIRKLLVERESVYSAVSLRVDTTHITPEQVADAVLSLYCDRLGRSAEEVQL